MLLGTVVLLAGVLLLFRQPFRSGDQVEVLEARRRVVGLARVLDEYRKAPQVTRERMYLETMERVLGNTDKMVLDSGSGAVPYLPINPSRSSQ